MFIKNFIILQNTMSKELTNHLDLQLGCSSSRIFCLQIRQNFLDSTLTSSRLLPLQHVAFSISYCLFQTYSMAHSQLSLNFHEVLKILHILCYIHRPLSYYVLYSFLFRDKNDNIRRIIVYTVTHSISPRTYMNVLSPNLRGGAIF